MIDIFLVMNVLTNKKDIKIKYLITVPQMAKSKNSRLYNLNNEIIEVEITETFPNGTVYCEGNNKEFKVLPFNIYIKKVGTIPDYWEGKTVYLMFDSKEEAQKMNKKLLKKIINNYKLFIEEFNNKINKIELLIK